MKRDRTNTLIDVEFSHEGKKEKVSVWVPFEVFVEAIRKIFDDGSINLDGTDKDIWNIFVDLDMLDKFEDNDDFIKNCEEIYKKSKYYEEDLDNWIEDTKEDY